jgi:hypothetical protein
VREPAYSGGDRTAIPEKRQSLLHGEEHTLHVRREDAIEVLLGDRAKPKHVPAAGVGEDDVEVPWVPRDLGIDADPRAAAGDQRDLPLQ